MLKVVPSETKYNQKVSKDLGNSNDLDQVTPVQDQDVGNGNIVVDNVNSYIGKINSYLNEKYPDVQLSLFSQDDNELVYTLDIELDNDPDSDVAKANSDNVIGTGNV